jgi:nitroreductase/NAD-dependent dihydropyrimidine dehydrogenase PreA subunit
MTPALIVDPSKCTKCGLCVKLCPASLLMFGDSGFPEMDAHRAPQCLECGHCAIFCPTKANSLTFLKDEELVPCSSLKTPSQEEGLNLLRTRRSIRRYKKETVPRETLDEIFSAVRMAPTACNYQKVRWVLSDDPKKTDEIRNLVLCWLRGEIFKDPVSELALAGAQMIARARQGEDLVLRGAPQVILAVLPKDYEWQEDGAIALTYFELAAQACGVGACWGGFLTMAVRNFPELREFLGIKEDERVCGAQMFGWPAARPVRLFPHRKLNVTRV